MMILSGISILMLLAYAALLLFYRRGWMELKEFDAEGIGGDARISVVVPARNEERNLPLLLQALKEQSYSAELFEVVVVDDFSGDRTADVVREFMLRYQEFRLRLISPGGDPVSSSKKKAVAAGVATAEEELVVTTDADCIPGSRWLQTIAAFYRQKDASFIAGPVQYTYTHGITQVFQALDFMTLQGITAASVGSGFHDMCNGANLAYTRSAFAEVDGFNGIDHVASGDDMLLMYKIRKAHPGRVFYLKSRDAIVTTASMTTWKEFVNQRRRWASKTLVYQDWRIKAVLGFVYLFNCFFLPLAVLAFFGEFYIKLLLLVLAGKILAELFFLYPVAKFYRGRSLLLYFIFFQPLHILYTVSVGFLSQLGKYEWKGRRTR
jgi:cellulose synthase/poly-beta-1,6-N-acetylglucosamine synthase-like glycosyltransferase